MFSSPLSRLLGSHPDPLVRVGMGWGGGGEEGVCREVFTLGSLRYPTSSLCPCCAGHVKSGKERLSGAGPLSGVL